jgi:hypothetical protein
MGGSVGGWGDAGHERGFKRKDKFRKEKIEFQKKRCRMSKFWEIARTNAGSV